MAKDTQLARAALEEGQAAFNIGDYAAAEAHFARALQADPDHAEAHQWSFSVHHLLAGISLPGPHYLEMITMIHAQLRPRTYLEIGVATGQSIALARPETRAIGIDPEPRVAAPLGPHVAIRAATSDAYFERHDVRGDLG